MKGHLSRLREILSEGERLFSQLLQIEEQLRNFLVVGDIGKIKGLEDTRVSLQKQIASLEEKRRSLIPHGTGVGVYIRSKVQQGEREELLHRLEDIREMLIRVRALQEVNRCLLQERLRFSRELQDLVLRRQEVYNDYGQRRSIFDDYSLNLDRNC